MRSPAPCGATGKPVSSGMDQAFEADFCSTERAEGCRMVTEGIGICSWRDLCQCCPWQEGALNLGRRYSLHSPFCLEQRSLCLRGEGHPRVGHPFQQPWPTPRRAFASQALRGCTSCSGHFLLCRTPATKGGKVYGGETSFSQAAFAALPVPRPGGPLARRSPGN